MDFLASQKDWIVKKNYSSKRLSPTPTPTPNYLPGKISSFPCLENPEVCVSAKG